MWVNLRQINFFKKALSSSAGLSFSRRRSGHTAAGDWVYTFYEFCSLPHIKLENPSEGMTIYDIIWPQVRRTNRRTHCPEESETLQLGHPETLWTHRIPRKDCWLNPLNSLSDI